MDECSQFISAYSLFLILTLIYSLYIAVYVNTFLLYMLSDKFVDQTILVEFA